MSHDEEKAVACALLSQDELLRLGPSLKRVFALPSDTSFDELLIQLDRATEVSDTQQ